MSEATATLTAVVTGGGTGLGQACVTKLLEQGYRVLSLGMDVEEVIDDPMHEHRMFDVTDDAAIAELVAGLDRLDVLMNCAGIILHEKRELTDAGFARVIEVNLSGTQKICYAAEGLLEAYQGAIVNFASMWSFFGSGRIPDTPPARAPWCPLPARWRRAGGRRAYAPMPWPRAGSRHAWPPTQ